MAQAEHRITLEMGTTPEEFLRLIPALFPDDDFTIEAGRVRCARDGRELEIRIAPGQPRRIGPTVAIPVLLVEIAFSGFDEAAQAGFMERFRAHYQRGGG